MKWLILNLHRVNLKPSEKAFIIWYKMQMDFAMKHQGKHLDSGALASSCISKFYKMEMR